MENSYDWDVVKSFLWFLLVGCLLTAGLAYVYSSLIVPIGISLFLSYLLAPVVDRYDHVLPRGLVVSILLLATILLMTILSVTLFPALYQEVSRIVQRLPAVVDLALNKWLPYLKNMAVRSEFVSELEVDRVINELSSIGQLSESASQALSTIWYSVPRVMGTVLNVVMVPVITFFLLLNFPRIKRYFGNLIPLRLRGYVDGFLLRVDDTLSAVVKGQVTVACILAVLYILGFSVIGMDAAFLLGLLAGLCRVVPYFDVIIGGSLGLIALLSNYQGPGQVVGLLVVIAVVQSLDGMFITPRIIGERVGLHPAVVIVSVLAFGSSFGFWGVILAIPAVALFKALWIAATPYYFATRAYRQP